MCHDFYLSTDVLGSGSISLERIALIYYHTGYLEEYAPKILEIVILSCSSHTAYVTRCIKLAVGRYSRLPERSRVKNSHSHADLTSLDLM